MGAVCEGGVALPYASPSFWAAGDSSEHRVFYECLSEHACPGGQYDAQAQAVTVRSQCAQGERIELQNWFWQATDEHTGDVMMKIADARCIGLMRVCNRQRRRAVLQVPEGLQQDQAGRLLRVQVQARSVSGRPAVPRRRGAPRLVAVCVRPTFPVFVHKAVLTPRSVSLLLQSLCNAHCRGPAGKWSEHACVVWLWL
jgi:hypothetical protein